MKLSPSRVLHTFTPDSPNRPLCVRSMASVVRRSKSLPTPKRKWSDEFGQSVDTATNDTPETEYVYETRPRNQVKQRRLMQRHTICDPMLSAQDLTFWECTSCCTVAMKTRARKTASYYCNSCDNTTPLTHIEW